MAKKEKFDSRNVIINKEDLAITKIGEMPNAEKSPIFLFLVFGIFIIFAFFLPDIVKYFGGEDEVVNNNKIVEPDETQDLEEDKNETVYYNIDSSINIDLESGIRISNLSLQSNSLLFTISNSTDSRFYFSKRNYFMEIYSSDKTLLERIILTKDSISKDSSNDYTYSLLPSTYANAKLVTFILKDENDYPNVSLSLNESDEEILTCVNDYETITYKFNDDKLVSIVDVVNYTSTDSLDYQNDLSLWQSRVTNYNNIKGMSSSFVSNANGFMVNTVLDLPNVNLSSVDNEYYYKHETAAKVVNFEMESRGFSCK